MTEKQKGRSLEGQKVSEKDLLNFSRSYLLTFFFLLASACTYNVGAPALDTPPKRYLAAALFFEQGLERFAAHLEAIQEPGARARLVKKVGPVIEDARLALLIWHDVIADPAQVHLAEGDWIRAKNMLIDAAAEFWIARAE